MARPLHLQTPPACRNCTAIQRGISTPYDYDVDLDALAAQPVAAPDAVLQKYSWDKTADFWLHEIEKYAKGVRLHRPHGKAPLRLRKLGQRFSRRVPSCAGLAQRESLPFQGRWSS